MKKVIATKAAPAAIGPYSQAIEVGNMLFASGQIPINPATSEIVEGGIKERHKFFLILKPYWKKRVMRLIIL